MPSAKWTDARAWRVGGWGTPSPSTPPPRSTAAPLPPLETQLQLASHRQGTDKPNASKCFYSQQYWQSFGPKWGWSCGLWKEADGGSVPDQVSELAGTGGERWGSRGRSPSRIGDQGVRSGTNWAVFKCLTVSDLISRTTRRGWVGKGRRQKAEGRKRTGESVHRRKRRKPRGLGNSSNADCGSPNREGGLPKLINSERGMRSAGNRSNAECVHRRKR